MVVDTTCDDFRYREHSLRNINSNVLNISIVNSISEYEHIQPVYNYNFLKGIINIMLYLLNTTKNIKKKNWISINGGNKIIPFKSDSKFITDKKVTNTPQCNDIPLTST